MVGEHDAIGLSPFAFNLRNPADYAYQKQGNEKLLSLTPIISNHIGKGSMNGLYFDQDSTTRTIEREGVRIKASHYFTLPWDPRATDGSTWKPVGGLIIRISPMEYIIAGSGLVLTFEPADNSTETGTLPILGEDGFATGSTSTRQSSASNSPSKAQTSSHTQSRLGIASVNEVEVNPDGILSRIRTFNGDETHQGRHVRIGVDDFKILHVKLYKYE